MPFFCGNRVMGCHMYAMKGVSVLVWVPKCCPKNILSLFESKCSISGSYMASKCPLYSISHLALPVLNRASNPAGCEQWSLHQITSFIIIKRFNISSPLDALAVVIMRLSYRCIDQIMLPGIKWFPQGISTFKRFFIKVVYTTSVRMLRQLALDVQLYITYPCLVSSMDLPTAPYSSSYMTRVWNPTSIASWSTRHQDGYLAWTARSRLTATSISRGSLVIICTTFKLIMLCMCSYNFSCVEQS